MIKKCLLLSCIIFIFSCTVKNNKSELLHFEEKNPVSLFLINIPSGSVDVKGWAKDYISIDLEKKVLKGLKSELKFMDISFNRNNNRAELTALIPDRIDGEINVRANVPFATMKSVINVKNANILFDQCLGDLEINNQKGIVKVNFAGDNLRITSENGEINALIKTENSSDVVIKNKDGDINAKVISAQPNSFLDIKNSNGNINFEIKKDIPHIFSLSGKNEIAILYDYKKKMDIKGEMNYISGFVGEGNYKIDLTNVNGKIKLSQPAE